MVRVARKLGFELDRQSGSHAIYYCSSDKRRIVVPIHPGKDIKEKNSIWNYKRHRHRGRRICRVIMTNRINQINQIKEAVNNRPHDFYLYNLG